ncbi:MAG TPA: PAS domain-containing protein [Polyangiales bacterium]
MHDGAKTRDELLQELLLARAQIAVLHAGHEAQVARAREPTLATLLANSPDSITLLDLEGRLVYANRALSARPVEELIGTRAGDHLPSQDRAAFQAAFEQVLASAQPLTLDLRTVSGYVWETRLVPVKDSGEVFAVMAIGADISARKRAESALRESEEKLRVALSATGLGLWRLELSRKELAWDAATSRMLGLGEQPLCRSLAAYEQVLHPDDRGRVLDALTRYVERGVYEDLEQRVYTPDGELRTLLSKGSPLRNSDGELIGFSGGIFDITERKRLEEQLRQSQKMEALGQLTAGIAHNFNNMLTVILSNVLVAESRVPEELRPRLRDAEHAARRAADMVRELMVFARRYPTSSKQPLDVREVVSRTVDICRTTFDRNIEVVAALPEAIGLVLADAGQLEQVLLNICLNARDALEGQTTPRPVIDLCVKHTAQAACSPRGELMIRISDNGPGMSADVKSRIFEPFFTTKDVGRGTGLGLATAYGSIVDHGGTIECESKEGAGASFVVRLPCIEPARVPADRGTGRSLARGGAGMDPKSAQPTILLIEDEVLVRRTTSTVLSTGGYDVIEAADGEEGLLLYDRQPSRIDLVLLDWSMPRLSGQRVLEELVRRSPGVKVVLFSGCYPAGDLQPNVRAIIPKPSAVDSVLGTIRAALDA